MREMARFRQGSLAPAPMALRMLAHGLCALVGLRNALSNGAEVLFEVEAKEKPTNRPITCDNRGRIALDARKALRETLEDTRDKNRRTMQEGGFPWRKKTNTAE